MSCSLELLRDLKHFMTCIMSMLATVSRPLHSPVFDCLQQCHAKMYRKGLVQMYCVNGINIGRGGISWPKEHILHKQNFCLEKWVAKFPFRTPALGQKLQCLKLILSLWNPSLPFELHTISDYKLDNEKVWECQWGYGYVFSKCKFLLIKGVRLVWSDSCCTLCSCKH